MTAPSKIVGTGLEEVNIPGQAYLRESLTSCTDPLKAIENFQVSTNQELINNFRIIKNIFRLKMVFYCHL